MSENITAAIALNGEMVIKQPLIKSMAIVRKETLRLISDWVSRTTDHQMVCFINLVLKFHCFINYLELSFEFVSSLNTI